MKKAYLVEFSIRTRIVADLDTTTEDKLIEKAIDRILDNPSSYVHSENIVGYPEDKYMPYDPEDFDKDF